MKRRALNPQQLQNLKHRLKRLAFKAYDARGKFEDLFYKIKSEQPALWAALCEEAGVDTAAEPGDWIC